MISEKTKKELIQAALAAQKHAYAPYSNFFVGAALLTDLNKIYKGCNVETAAYGSTICAERAAVVNAIANGDSKFVALALVAKTLSYPCGACRQFLNEFNPNLLIIAVNADLAQREEKELHALLPHSFGPLNLVK